MAEKLVKIFTCKNPWSSPKGTQSSCMSLLDSKFQRHKFSDGHNIFQDDLYIHKTMANK